MKNQILSIFSAIIAFGSAMTSCGGVEEYDRFIPTKPVEVARTVLIEDFTGQNCVNCPAAHEVLDRLAAQYPENIIPVSIHAGHFSVKTELTKYPDFIGLAQPEGDAMAARWGITAYPTGVVNRTGGTLEADAWADAVRRQLSEPSRLGVEVEADILPDAPGEIAVSVTLDPQENVSGTLHVWVVESGITAYQLSNGQGLIPDYIHDNVYRCAVDGVDGTPVSLTMREPQTLTYSQAVRNTATERWDTSNLSVVAFVETESEGVLQAAAARVALNN
ncbi:MAG: Omp28 family outer membrane lipoprotein [Duncaniella sp.]|nr:Omp28 family outer membrane lipoprotein [Duncaniella sp.]MDE6390012.1 Omp28 family outer membrane lipoprotein [Duncaniella sp.]